MTLNHGQNQPTVELGAKSSKPKSLERVDTGASASSSTSVVGSLASGKTNDTAFLDELDTKKTGIQGADVDHACGEAATMTSSVADPPRDPSLTCFSPSFWPQLLKFLGPGFLVATGYIDPGNLSADINQGVQAGYQLTWVTLYSTVIGLLVQIVAARLGVITGRHLAQHGRAEYPPFARILVWGITELGIIATDMIEVMGGAVAFSALTNGALPLWAGVLITGIGSFFLLGLEHWGMRLLEFLLMSLIALMAITFGYMFFSTGVDYGAVAKGLFVPHLNSNTINLAVGAVGAIITPHNLYLHSALVLTHGEALRATTHGQAMRYVSTEASLALFTALGINIFVIAVFAHLFSSGSSSSLAGAVGLGNAGQALASAQGKQMQYIWGVGLLAAAFASTVTSTYAGQVVMTAYLGVKVSAWWRTAAVRLFTLGPTLSVALLVHTETALTGWTEVLNIIQSLVLPFVVIPLLTFTSSTKIMGQHVNRLWAVIALSSVLVALLGLNGYLVVTFAIRQLPAWGWARALFSLACILYATFVAYLLAGPVRVHSAVRYGIDKLVARWRKPEVTELVECCQVNDVVPAGEC